MPNRQEHLDLSTFVGIPVALYSSRSLTGWPALVHAAGCVAASRWGGILPDLLEPALHPGHRAFWHSQLTLVGSVQMSVDPPAVVRTWRGSLFAEAKILRARREALPEDHPDRSTLWTDEMLRYFLAGALVGLPAGYLTHRPPDAGSPSGLPLFG